MLRPALRIVVVASMFLAPPAIAQVTIAENGIQIDEPSEAFSLNSTENLFDARLWVHGDLPRYVITILDKQDPNNGYTGMDWEERAWDPIASQDADISAYYQGNGWAIFEGEVAGNGFFQRSIIKEGCPVIATLIVEYPREARALAQVEFTRLAESLTIAPSPLCP